MSAPSDKALVPFVSVENMLALIHGHGIQICLMELADMIEAFSAMRWLREYVAQGVPIEMLDVIADPDDPRDLFGMTTRFATRAKRAA